MRYLTLSLFVLALGLGSIRTDRSVHTDLRYAERSAQNQLDLHVPEGPAAAPLVVWWHDEAGVDRDLREALLEAGLAVATVELGAGATLAADVRDALALLRVRGEALRVDPTRLATLDSRAVGHESALATSLATAGRLAAAVVRSPGPDSGPARAAELAETVRALSADATVPPLLAVPGAAFAGAERRIAIFLVRNLLAPHSSQEGDRAAVPEPAAVVARAVAAAEALLETLDEEQRDALTFAFDDADQRRRWSNLPVSMVERLGLRMGDLSAEQQGAAYALLAATLSPEGYTQVLENVRGDEVLVQRGSSMPFGFDHFYVSILGTPSTESPWMWQFGGHHLALNVTLAGDRVSLSPSLTGAQPVDYTWEGEEVHQLTSEREPARALVASLTDEQRARAVVSDRIVNLAFGPGEEGPFEPTEGGLPGSALDEDQRALLTELVAARVGILHEAHAARELEAFEAAFDETSFAWYGSTQPGEAASFRVQGPSLLMEYAPQGNDARGMQHIHAMFREPGNDYGAEDVEGGR